MKTFSKQGQRQARFLSKPICVFIIELILFVQEDGLRCKADLCPGATDQSPLEKVIRWIGDSEFESTSSHSMANDSSKDKVSANQERASLLVKGTRTKVAYEENTTGLVAIIAVGFASRRY